MTYNHIIDPNYPLLERRAIYQAISRREETCVYLIDGELKCRALAGIPDGAKLIMKVGRITSEQC